MYPNYVYRPQRVKGKEAAANGKGKAHGAEEPETDSEGLAFVMPVPAVPQRVGRRAISAPTPPRHISRRSTSRWCACHRRLPRPAFLALDGPCNCSMHLLSNPNPHPAIFHWLGLRFCPIECFVRGGLQQQPPGWNPDNAACGNTT
jgi:hypothetical protein